jgi:hypothetical protein
MEEINYVWCYLLCALALWLESLRSVKAIRMRAEKFHVSDENVGPGRPHDLLEEQMEQTSSWTGLRPPGDLLKLNKSSALAESESRLEISLNTPWLYLSLALMFWLLLL